MVEEYQLPKIVPHNLNLKKRLRRYQECGFSAPKGAVDSPKSCRIDRLSCAFGFWGRAQFFSLPIIFHRHDGAVCALSRR